MSDHPTLHQGQPLYHTGAELADAAAAMVLVHGRGATAPSILELAGELGRKQNVAYVAPQAANNTWYPHRFLAPMASNEPWLSSALETVDQVLGRLADEGIPAEQTILLGFSQGACLCLEYAARHARRYGGVVGLSGGLIGPPGTPFTYPGSLEGTPVFLGCSDVDFHIPEERVHESARALAALGAAVDTRIYPGMGHTVVQDEVYAVQEMMAQLLR